MGEEQLQDAVGLGDLTFRPTKDKNNKAEGLDIRPHDSHNIEVKAQLNIPHSNARSKLEIFVFFPKTFQYSLIEKNDILKDLRSMMKVNIAGSFDNNNHLLLLHCENLIACIEKGIKYEDELSKNCQILVNSITDKFKAVIESQSLEDLDFLYKTLKNIRSHIERIENNLLHCMDEFISQNFIQTLIHLQINPSLKPLVEKLRSDEVIYREKKGFSLPEEISAKDLESKLTRLSQLKKFFQSQSFIEVKRVSGGKKINEAAATTGTLFAGVIAASLNAFGIQKISELALSGLMIATFGVIIYVFRDRLKDWARHLFHKKASKLIPDFVTDLQVERDSIGVAREWLKVCDTRELDTIVQNKRQELASNAIEKNLAEDVLCFKKKVKLHKNKKFSSKNYKVFNDTIRVNFSRHLKHMDDPVKEFVEITPQGETKKFSTNKVYNFYIYTKLTHYKKDKGEFKEFSFSEISKKIVLNKNGIVRLEPIELLSQK